MQRRLHMGELVDGTVQGHCRCGVCRCSDDTALPCRGLEEAVRHSARDTRLRVNEQQCFRSLPWVNWLFTSSLSACPVVNSSAAFRGHR